MSQRFATPGGHLNHDALARWGTVKEGLITWHDIKEMKPKRISLLIKALYDILPMSVSLPFVDTGKI